MTSEQPTHPEDGPGGLLGAARIRELAQRHGVRPTKQWGQNFVVDANTVRRIVRAGEVTAQDHVVEIGPGLGSLTLALLEAAGRVTAVEVDPVLAAALPGTVAEEAPGAAARLEVVHADAMSVTELPGPAPTALVANLPYNISVPVVLHFLETFPSIERVLVMVQLEVAERLAAGPGSKTYGVPSVKAAWWTDVALAGRVSRTIFWPVPNVDSGLVRLVRREPPQTAATREQVLPSSTLPSPSDARRCGPPFAPWRARVRSPSRPSSPPGWTRAPGASSSTWRPSRGSPRNSWLG